MRSEAPSLSSPGDDPRACCEVAAPGLERGDGRTPRGGAGDGAAASETPGFSLPDPFGPDDELQLALDTDPRLPRSREEQALQQLGQRREEDQLRYLDRRAERLTSDAFYGLVTETREWENITEYLLDRSGLIAELPVDDLDPSPGARYPAQRRLEVIRQVVRTWREKGLA